jgi:hypothetical protein
VVVSSSAKASFEVSRHPIEHGNTLFVVGELR